uniref:AlNc14C24G2425 protein n=1 Tax=Albugo laibachii Nc14 TaxID=890382 RepID=F0W6C5_9STRA|nr:AlNc14C24G2425 [Albugo laibachii Nc14]|eukprot:CCA16669.1 AlNc14C24G2425 [Albugo laibachii Nc14]
MQSLPAMLYQYSNFTYLRPKTEDGELSLSKRAVLTVIQFLPFTNIQRKEQAEFREKHAHGKSHVQQISIRFDSIPLTLCPPVFAGVG